MNCRRRGKPSGADHQVNKPKPKPAPEMRKGDGISPKSFDPVTRHPYWEDAAKTISGNK